MSEVFSPYQIDYSVKNTSKTFGFSKKKIIFKFGIANPPAVAAGESGAACRGSEHEIIFIWSLNSGKRQIMCDGKDVHYSETGQNGWTADQVFQHHWQLNVPGLSGPIRCHLITQPANRDIPHIKPFDIRLNGVSYFAIPQIFQLGTSRMVVRPVKGKGQGGRGGGGGYSNRGGGGQNEAYMSPDERQAVAAAKLASMQEMNRFGGSQSAPYGARAPAPVAPVADLLSFDAPAPAPNPYGQPPPQQYGQPPPQQQAYSNYSLGGAPPPQQQPNQFQQPQSYGQQPPQQQMQQPPPPQAYGYQQPPPAMAPQFSSPPAKSVTSYQSYGSAPSFAQPPQQQQQQPPQQYGQQPPPPQGQYYGQPPAPHGY